MTKPREALEPDETVWDVLARRFVTVPLFTLLLVTCTAALPVAWAVSLVVDPVRGARLTLGRTATFLVLYLWTDLGVVARGIWAWLRFGQWTGRDEVRLRAADYRTERWWARTLFPRALGLFGARFRTAGLEEVLPGPVLVFARHASAGDTILPLYYLSVVLGLNCRYVLKTELKWDPAFDLVGGRLPNCFVRRGGQAVERETARLRQLASGLGPDEALVIFPEGTRFSRRKRSAILTKLREHGHDDAARRAEELEHTLPPRPAGALALLEAAPEADVVFCAHTGFEHFATFSRLLYGQNVGSELKSTWWRVPRSEIPEGQEARVAWLHQQWLRVDAIVAAGARQRRAHNARLESERPWARLRGALRSPR